MPRYALVSPTDTVDRYATDMDPNVETKAGWRWLPVVTTDPAHNSETQVKTGPVVTVNASDVTLVYTVRAKTAGELDADKDSEFDGVNLIARKVLFDFDKRLRTLESLPPRTAAQFKAYAKAL